MPVLKSIPSRQGSILTAKKMNFHAGNILGNIPFHANVGLLARRGLSGNPDGSFVCKNGRFCRVALDFLGLRPGPDGQVPEGGNVNTTADPGNVHHRW